MRLHFVTCDDDVFGVDDGAIGGGQVSAASVPFGNAHGACCHRCVEFPVASLASFFFFRLFFTTGLFFTSILTLTGTCATSGNTVWCRFGTGSGPSTGTTTGRGFVLMVGFFLGQAETSELLRLGRGERFRFADHVHQTVAAELGVVAEERTLRLGLGLAL